MSYSKTIFRILFPCTEKGSLNLEFYTSRSPRPFVQIWYPFDSYFSPTISRFNSLPQLLENTHGCNSKRILTDKLSKVKVLGYSKKKRNGKPKIK